MNVWRISLMIFILSPSTAMGGWFEEGWVPSMSRGACYLGIGYSHYPEYLAEHPHQHPLEVNGSRLTFLSVGDFDLLTKQEAYGEDVARLNRQPSLRFRMDNLKRSPETVDWSKENFERYPDQIRVKVDDTHLQRAGDALPLVFYADKKNSLALLDKLARGEPLGISISGDGFRRELKVFANSDNHGFRALAMFDACRRSR